MLLLVLRVVEGLLATDLCVLVVVLRTDLVCVLFTGFLSVVVLLVTVVLLGVLVTDLLVTVFRCGDLVVVLLVTFRLAVDLVLVVRADLVCTFFDLSTAVLPATFVFDLFVRVPEFRTTSPLLLFDL